MWPSLYSSYVLSIRFPSAVTRGALAGSQKFDTRQAASAGQESDRRLPMYFLLHIFGILSAINLAGAQDQSVLPAQCYAAASMICKFGVCLYRLIATDEANNQYEEAGQRPVLCNPTDVYATALCAVSLCVSIHSGPVSSINELATGFGAASSYCSSLAVESPSLSNFITYVPPCAAYLAVYSASVSLDSSSSSCVSLWDESSTTNPTDTGCSTICELLIR